MTQIESTSRKFEAENRRLEGQLDQANKDLQDLELEVEKLHAEAQLQEENHREVVQIESEEKATLKTALQDLTEECDELRSENVRMKSTNQKLESEIELFSLEQRGKSTEIKNTKEILTKDCFQLIQSVFSLVRFEICLLIGQISYLSCNWLKTDERLNRREMNWFS